VANEKMLVQHKSIKELHASLTLPLVTNASLVFLKRHLALSASQLALIDESVKANSARQECFERALADTETEVRIHISFANETSDVVTDLVTLSLRIQQKAPLSEAERLQVC